MQSGRGLPTLQRVLLPPSLANPRSRYDCTRQNRVILQTTALFVAAVVIASNSIFHDYFSVRPSRDVTVRNKRESPLKCLCVLHTSFARPTNKPHWHHFQ